MTDPKKDQQTNHDDLASALGAMADGEHAETQQDQLSDDAPENEAAESHDALAGITSGDGGESNTDGGVDLDEAFAGTAPDSGARAKARRSAGTTSGKSFQPTPFHYWSVRLSIVMGVLLLVPAILAVLVLIGVKMPLSQKENATAFAALLLVCWPVAGGLLAGAWYFNKQLKIIEARNAARK